MQASSKAAKIRARLSEFCTLMSFEYRGLYCDIGHFDPHRFHIMCGDEEQDVHSIEEFMERPLFAGASLQDIADAGSALSIRPGAAMAQPARMSSIPTIAIYQRALGALSPTFLLIIRLSGRMNPTRTALTRI